MYKDTNKINKYKKLLKKKEMPSAKYFVDELK
jgi:hypothetical protein